MMDWLRPDASGRAPVLGANVVSTSQPLAAQAGLRMLLEGGNAVDAAVATAMALTVLEPRGCGIGSDAFAIVWDGRALHGLNASGQAPAAWQPERFRGLSAMPATGWESVTVPGAVSAWAALSQRFGRLPFRRLAEPAIAYARDGFAVSPTIARLWAHGAARLGTQPGFAECFLPDGRAPGPGDLFRSEAHARTLAAIAASGGEDFYRGELAERIAAHARAHGAALTRQDLAAHRADWCAPLAMPFAGARVHELPPNGTGVATLIALGILEALQIGDFPLDSADAVHLQIEAMKLALADLDAYNADPRAMRTPAEALLDPDYLAQRARLVERRHAGAPGHGAPRPGGTVYLCAGDAQGMMVSFIQSNYMGFGSGVVVPGTGISLQNRGHGFTLQPGHANEVGPAKRPSHTIIPGFATTAQGEARMAFGVMGGPMQTQGHVQMAMRVLLHGQNPQAAADAPRWRVVSGRTVAVEPAFDPQVLAELRARGHAIVVEPGDGVFAFGGAQLLVKGSASYVAGSDPRKDGQAVAY